MWKYQKYLGRKLLEFCQLNNLILTHSANIGIFINIPEKCQVERRNQQEIVESDNKQVSKDINMGTEAKTLDGNHKKT